MARKMNSKQKYIANVMGQMRLKQFEDVCNNTTPCIYAALAVALYEKGWRHKRISELFARSQQIWTEHCYDRGDMTDYCYNITGIDVMNPNESGMEI